MLDATSFVNNGGTFNTVPHVAGNFTTSGTTDIADWTPSAGTMTDMGNNMYSITVTFQTPNTTDSLNFKYVKGGDWADGDEGGDWANPNDPTCMRPSDNHNRKFLLPASGSVTYFSEWASCPTAAAVRGVAELKATDVFPNPANNSLTVRAGQEPITGVRIIAADGKEVLNRSFSSVETATVNVSNLPVGMYRVMAASKKSVSQKQFSVVR